MQSSSPTLLRQTVTQPAVVVGTTSHETKEMVDDLASMLRNHRIRSLHDSGRRGQEMTSEENILEALRRINVTDALKLAGEENESLGLYFTADGGLKLYAESEGESTIVILSADSTARLLTFLIRNYRKMGAG